MSNLIQAIRPEVSRIFPIPGFRIRTASSPAWGEVAVATSADLLFDPAARGRRNRSNFYSSRSAGLFPIERGEAVYLLPPGVMARFAGQNRLYYSLAIYPQPSPQNPEVKRLPLAVVPFVNVSSSYRGEPQGILTVPNQRGSLTSNGYGEVDQTQLEWGGDVAPAGEMVPVPAAPATGGNGRGDGRGDGRDNNGAGTTTGTPGASAPAAEGQGLAFDYDDGFDTALWSRPLEVPQQVEDPGIESPIADDLPYAEGQRYSAALATSPDYSGASQFIQARWYRTPATPRTIRRVVIHITDGAGRRAVSTARYFQDPRDRTGGPIQVSAHYVVGQDGDLVQMVRHADVAFHAHGANADSIGIEHQANTRGMNLTEDQYCLSAALVNWLCTQYNIPMDRTHILGHAEADPNTTHAGCPNALWNWDYYMGLVTSASCYPMPQGQAMAARALEAWSFNVHWDDVQLVPQPTQMSCWAAAAAMVVGWRDRISISPDTISSESGYGWEYFTGLSVNNVDELALALGLVAESPQCYTVDAFRQLIEYNGPLWVGINPANSGHAVVVTGIYGDGSLDNTYVRVNDPWPVNRGATYTKRLSEFMQEYENLCSTDPAGNVNAQVVHAGGRTPMTLAYGAGARSVAATRRPASAARRAGGNGTPTAAAISRTLELSPLDGTAIERMRQEFVANSQQGSPRSCIVIANAGLRRLYGDALIAEDGSNRRLGTTIQDTMAALQGYGLADAAHEFEFNDASGHLTRGVARPHLLRQSVEQWIVDQAEANQMSGWYAMGLSIMDGYHSVVLALQFSGRNSPDTHLYWADQIYSGWDDVTGTLDDRITGLTQRWWDPLPQERKARTRVTVWPLMPAAAPASTFGADETDDIEGYEEEPESISQALGRGDTQACVDTCTDEFCPTNSAPTAGSTNFCLGEFRCRDGTDVPERFRGNVQALMDNLEILRAELGNQAITITSGYRTCSYNCTLEGAAGQSRHLCGQAADIQVAGHTPEQVHSTIERLIGEGRMNQGGLGLYNTFVHYDVRGGRARWDHRR